MSNAGFTQPQFAASGSSGGQCQFCGQRIGSSYCRVNDAMACPVCIEQKLSERTQDAPAAFARALTAGLGAAVVGMIGYALIAIILQGWVVSIMSVGVGFLIGTAMMKASKGVGGRRYQIAAVLLTYAAVSMAAVPIWIYFSNQHKAQQTEQQKLESEQRQLEEESGRAPQDLPSQPKPRMSMGEWLGRVVLIGLASPFLALRATPSAAIGLLILFVGMRVAWRAAAGHPFQVYGPFDSAKA